MNCISLSNYKNAKNALNKNLFNNYINNYQLKSTYNQFRKKNYFKFNEFYKAHKN